MGIAMSPAGRGGETVELELRHLFMYARRWWWLLVLLPLLAAGTAYAVSSRQQPLYRATATLLIKPGQGQGTDNVTAIRTGQSLAATYQQLVVTEPVLEPVIERLSLPYTADQLADKVSSSTVRDTQLLRVSASDTNPELAAEIANAVAEQFSAFISEQELESSTSARQALQQLIDETQRQVEDTRQQIRDLEAAPQLSPEDQAQLDGLRIRLSQLETSLAGLLVQAQNLDLNAAALQNQVRVYVPATIPQSPYAPRTLFYTLLGAFLGGIIAVGAVGLLEYLDNTVKASLDFPALVGAPLLSVVGAVPKLKDGRDQLFVLHRPKSTVAESVRLLRANLEFAAAAKEITSLAVTSAGPNEGKSTITANLSIAMAQAGFTTVVIDADLRRPTQHKIFGIGNMRGLTTLLTHPEQPWQSAAVPVLGPYLSVIPCGPIPPNPADLLSLDRFKQLIDEINQAVDIVIIDTSPVLAVSDPLVIASRVDGVALVCRAGRTRIDALRRAAQTLTQGEVRLVGVVVNHQTGREGAGYYYYYDKDYYGADADQTQTRKAGVSDSAQTQAEPSPEPLQ